MDRRLGAAVSSLMEQSPAVFPPLPLEEWEQTKNTLHLFLQIVGKVRLATHPKTNHWWHVTLYVSTRGLATGPIPFQRGLFEIEFDFLRHALSISTSGGQTRRVPLRRLSVADFYRKVSSALADLSIDVRIRPIPYDAPFSTIPFEQDTVHKSYDSRYVERFWWILCQVDSIFREFRGKFIGKSTPVQLYWHHLDLVLTLFCGKPAPEAGGNRVNREAYSHEVISFGFWAGDVRVREPAFYSYTYPLPPGLYDQLLKPPGAVWDREGGYALLRYDQVRAAASPRLALLDFLESAYQAGAQLAGWDLEALRLRPPGGG